MIFAGDASATSDLEAGPAALRRVGFEIELLGQPGCTRADLARALCESGRGAVSSRLFHLDSEPSLVPGKPHFVHLSRGVAVSRPDGAPVCRLVDDITIDVPDDASDDDVGREPADYRIVSDEARLLRLIARNAEPEASIDEVLAPIGALFGTRPVALDNGIRRLDDAEGASIAMAVEQAPGRQRVCEIVTPVIDCDHRARLAELLGPAAELRFVVPTHAAVHVHFDAEPFRQPARLRRLVDRFAVERDELWDVFETNEHCRRLGPVPPEVVELLVQADEAGASWSAVQPALAKLGLSKYVDLNLVNLVRRTPGKDTIEVRILAPSIDGDAIVDQVELLQTLIGELW